MALGEAQDMSPPGENKCLYTMCSVPCMAVATAHWNLVLWGFFFARYLEVTEASRILKTKSQLVMVSFPSFLMKYTFVLCS